MSRRQTISVDFDGVLHSYRTPWINAHTIPDEPVSGAIEWLYRLVQDFDVVIQSTRCKTWRGRMAIRAWLKKHAGTIWYESMGMNGIEGVRLSYKKLPAIVYIDDRAYRLDGVTFPSNKQLRAMLPWGRP